jgi:hypothetical protein
MDRKHIESLANADYTNNDSQPNTQKSDSKTDDSSSECMPPDQLIQRAAAISKWVQKNNPTPIQDKRSCYPQPPRGQGGLTPVADSSWWFSIGSVFFSKKSPQENSKNIEEQSTAVKEAIKQQPANTKITANKVSRDKKMVVRG